MGRIFFFIREGMRALRRSAAPSLAAIVTVAVTVLLLGVLIPVLQTTNGHTNEVRDPGGRHREGQGGARPGRPAPLLERRGSERDQGARGGGGTAGPARRGPGAEGKA